MDFPISNDTLARLEQFLADIGAYLWDRRQRASFAAYLMGLLSDLPGKSVEPIAALFAPDRACTDAAHQRLLHFLCDAPWPDSALRALAARYALAQMTRHGPVQTLILDDTAFAKSGSHSVGVQRQYCGTLGKLANCQVVVSLTAATAHSHMPLDMQLYLPQSWLDSPTGPRCKPSRRLVWPYSPKRSPKESLRRSYSPTRPSAMGSRFVKACARWGWIMPSAFI
jgi:SRSO17 transposase